MKSATINEIKKELKTRDPGEVMELCARLMRYKKENKELLTYILFESNDESAFIDGIKEEIDDLYRNFQNEQYLLTEEQKKTKVAEIEGREKAIKEYQKLKFGYEGELFVKRQELVKPIQDKVYEAIEKFAKERGYDFIFDKSSSTTLLYSNAENDKSDDIIKKLGYTPQK